MSNQKITPPNPIAPIIPVGTILAFTGSPDNIPNGWILCNETGRSSTMEGNYQGPIVPNLDGITLIGQGANYPIGQSGGNANHTLTLDEMPNHSHTIHNGNFGSLGTALETGDSGYIPYCTNDVFGTNGTDTAGGGKPHNNMQPYLVVYYIMFIGISTRAGLYL